MEQRPRSVAEEVDLIFHAQSDKAQVALLRLDRKAFAVAICQMIDAELGCNCGSVFLQCGYSLATIEEKRRLFIQGKERPIAMQASA